MGDQRGDERGPHGEAFDWEDGRTPRTSRRYLMALLECVLRAWLERGWMDVILDVIRAELVCRGGRRGALALSPEEPARVLLGGPAEGGGP